MFHVPPEKKKKKRGGGTCISWLKSRPSGNIQFRNRIDSRRRCRSDTADVDDRSWQTLLAPTIECSCIATCSSTLVDSSRCCCCCFHGNESSSPNIGEMTSAKVRHPPDELWSLIILHLLLQIAISWCNNVMSNLPAWECIEFVQFVTDGETGVESVKMSA